MVGMLRGPAISPRATQVSFATLRLAGRPTHSNCNATLGMRNVVEARRAPNSRRRQAHRSMIPAGSSIHYRFGKGAVMSSKLSMVKHIVVTTALVAGVAGVAHA